MGSAREGDGLGESAGDELWRVSVFVSWKEEQEEDAWTGRW